MALGPPMQKWGGTRGMGTMETDDRVAVEWHGRVAVEWHGRVAVEWHDEQRPRADVSSAQEQSHLACKIGWDQIGLDQIGSDRVG